MGIMKHYVLIFLVFVTLILIISTPVSAQLFTYTIGTGTTYNAATSAPTPYGTYYRNFRQQYLYRASEIIAAGGEAGTITTLGFNIQALNNIGTVPHYYIRMKQTSQTVLTTTFETGDYTQVWHQSFYAPPAIGWQPHTLSTPFVWDGTSNLLIDFVTTMAAASTENASVYYTQMPLINDYTSLRFQSNTVDASTATTGTLSYNRANLRLILFSPPNPAELDWPTEGSDRYCNTYLRWRSGGGGSVTGYKLYLGTDGGGVTTPTNLVNGEDLGNVTTYNPPGFLAVNQTWYWQIVPYNPVYEAENCPIWSFNTVPLSGTMNIGGGSSYGTFTEVINLLNHSGVTASGVTFKVADGTYSELTPPITSSGTETGRIVFEPAASANPVLSLTGVTGATYGFLMQGADYVTFDNIDISGPNTIENGYWLKEGTDHCTIHNCTINLAHGSTNAAIRAYGTNEYGSFLYNTINGPADRGVALESYAGNTGSHHMIQGNNISTVRSKSIYITGTVYTTITDNYITAPSTTSGYDGIHIYYSNAYVEVYGNTITGVTTSNALGILLDSPANVHHNLITDFGSTDASCIGIYQSTSGTTNIYSNTICHLSSSGAHIGVYGIKHSVQGVNKIYNNMIYDLANPNGNTVPQVAGIYHAVGDDIDYANNTIFLETSGNTDDFTTAGIYLGEGTDVNLQNNIVVNNSTPGSNGYAAALYRASNQSINGDCNIYYSGTPATRQVICYYNGTTYITMDNYKTAIYPEEQNSVTEQVPFMSDPFDPHIDPSQLTYVEGHAIPLAWVTYDIDGDIRNASNPDIGADEGDFASPYCQPANLLMPVVGASVFCNQPMTWAAGSGAAPTGYKLFLGTDNPPTDLVNGTDLGLTTSYVYLYLPVSDRIYWKVVPYNTNGDVENCPVWYFDTVPLSGELDINVMGGDFSSFTEAINLLNHSGVTSAGATFKVVGNFSEITPPITASGTENGMIVFVPQEDITQPGLDLTSVGGATYGFKLDGADYVFFNNIDITGPNTIQYGYWLTGGASHNRIQACTLNIPYNSTVPNSAIYSYGPNDYNNFVGNYIESDTYYAINLGGSEGNYCNYNMIQANNVPNGRRTAVLLDYAVHAVISGNYFSTISGSTSGFYAIWVKDTCDDTEIYLNTVHGSSVGAVYAMYLHADNCYVHHNTLTDLHGSGTMRVCGIYASSEGNNISHNRIGNLSYTGTGAYYVQGIYLGNGINQYVHNNIIYDLQNPSGTDDVDIYGIMLWADHPSYISNNTIYLNASGTTEGFITTGIYAPISTSVTLQNNIIVNLSTPGSSGFASCLYSPTGTVSILASETDNNIYYCGTPDTSHLIGRFNGVDYSTLTEYKTAALTIEQHSMTELVPFVSMTDPVDVHLRTDQPTLAESFAKPLAWVTDDFDGNARNALTPDIGADEGNFLAIPPQTPVGLYPPDGEIYVMTDAVLSWGPNSSGTPPAYYEIYLGTTNPPPFVMNQTGITYDPELDFDTTYYWFVTAVNPAGQASTSICSFTTAPDPTISALPHIQNFDEETAPILPYGWTVDKSEAQMQIIADTYDPISSPNTVRMYNGSYTSGELRFISPLVTVPMNSFNLKFYARGVLYTLLQVGTIDSAGRGVFTPLAEFSLNSIWTEFTVPFAGYAGTDQYICFRHGMGAPEQYLYIDNFLMEASAPPEAPQNVQLVYSGGVCSLHWDTVTGATEYRIYRSSDPAAPVPWSLLQTVTAPVTDYVIDTATSQGFYYVTALAGTREEPVRTILQKQSR